MSIADLHRAMPLVSSLSVRVRRAPPSDRCAQAGASALLSKSRLRYNMTQLLQLVALSLLIVLVGCAERTSTPTVTSTPTTAPQLRSAECPCSALENWLQRSSNLTQELSEVVNNNIAIQPERASDVIDRLGSIQVALEVAR